jgi:hypothetical protein
MESPQWAMGPMKSTEFVHHIRRFHHVLWEAPLQRAQLWYREIHYGVYGSTDKCCKMDSLTILKMLRAWSSSSQDDDNTSPAVAPELTIGSQKTQPRWLPLPHCGLQKLRSRRAHPRGLRCIPPRHRTHQLGHHAQDRSLLPNHSQLHSPSASLHYRGA